MPMIYEEQKSTQILITVNTSQIRNVHTQTCNPSRSVSIVILIDAPFKFHETVSLGAHVYMQTIVMAMHMYDNRDIQ